MDKPSPLSLPPVRVERRFGADHLERFVNPSDLARAIEIVADARVDEAVRQLGRQLAEIHAHASGNVDLHAGRLADIIDVWLASRSPREAGQDGNSTESDAGGWRPSPSNLIISDGAKPGSAAPSTAEDSMGRVARPMHEAGSGDPASAAGPLARDATPSEPGQDGPQDDWPPRCPKCNSPDPKRHPAVQFEGEVQICDHPFHTPEPGQDGGRDTVSLPAVAPEQSGSAMGQPREQSPSTATPSEPAAPAREVVDKIVADLTRYSEGFRGLVITHLCKEAADAISALQARVRELEAQVRRIGVRYSDAQTRADEARAAGFRECQEKSIIDADTVRASLAQHGRLYESDGAAEVIKVLRALTPYAGTCASAISAIAASRARETQLRARLEEFMAAKDFAAAEAWDNGPDMRQRLDHAHSRARLVLSEQPAAALQAIREVQQEHHYVMHHGSKMEPNWSGVSDAIKALSQHFGEP